MKNKNRIFSIFHVDFIVFSLGSQSFIFIHLLSLLQGKVIGFFDSWLSTRLWPVDMAGFAVSIEYLDRNPNVTMPYKAGWEEDGFLKSIGLKMHDIEPKANNCTEVLVWHTQTNKGKPAKIHIDNRVVESDDTSLGALLRALQSMGVSHTDPSSGIFPYFVYTQF